MKRILFPLLLLCLSAVTSCRHEELILYSDTYETTTPQYTSVAGFYLLNEGNMGTNSSTLDYFDATTGEYHKNIYAETNPTVIKELGDVGNDLQIYGSRLYAVINCSHKVEVMRAADASYIGKIDLPNCRYIRFHDGYAYVSSYVAPVRIDPHAPKGCVFKIDTATLQVVDTVTVGYQPEEMEIRFGKLYVANSGGYRVPDYDNTVSVIDLATFQEIKKIEVAINLHRIKGDRYGYLYVSSRGDYYDTHSKLYVIDARTDRLVDSLDIAVSNMCIDGDSAYVYSTEWNWTTAQNTVTYGIIDLKERRIVNRSFITDGTDAEIKIPYGIAVNPITKEIYVTDAKNYVVSGTLYCFSPEGKRLWKVPAGNIPAHFAFKGEYRIEHTYTN